MTAKIIQFPHVLEAEVRMQLHDAIAEEASKRVKTAIKGMVEKHDGYFVDLFLKLIDQIIDDGEKEGCEEKIMDQLLVLRYVVSEYCWV